MFLDESGFMLTPTVRRTLAPRGKTPILRGWDRHDRLSVIVGLTSLTVMVVSWVSVRPSLSVTRRASVRVSGPSLGTMALADCA